MLEVSWYVHNFYFYLSSFNLSTELQARVFNCTGDSSTGRTNVYTRENVTKIGFLQIFSLLLLPISIYGLSSLVSWTKKLRLTDASTFQMRSSSAPESPTTSTCKTFPKFECAFHIHQFPFRPNSPLLLLEIQYRAPLISVYLLPLHNRLSTQQPEQICLKVSIPSVFPPPKTQGS